MSDAVLVAVISANALVLSAIIPAIFSTRRHAKEAVNQVKNSHSTNLRDELDTRDRRIHKRFTRIEHHLGMPEQPEEETIP